MLKKILLVLIFFLSCLQVFAQSDTLINYNTVLNEIKYYPQTIVDSNETSSYTQWNYGIDSGLELLNTEPPENTYNNSGFTDLVPAQRLYQIGNYPIRTAVKIFYTKNDTLKQRCSGILVAKNLVLTDCHCVGVYDSTRNLKFYDSLYVFPGFDNGIENEIYKNSRGIEYITFSSNLKHWYQKDIALIKLENEIGERTGWVGIAFEQNDNVLWNSVFHKLSYPASVSIDDSTKIYNGDTLYYSYGTLDVIDSVFADNIWLGYNIFGIPGQSGSSLIFTDNEKFYTFGTQVWGNNSLHLRITPEIFYAFKPIIENGISDIESDDKNFTDYYLSEAYPNPFNAVTNIKYSMPSSGLVKLKVYDILGREVVTLINKFQQSGNYAIQFDADNLSSGVYFVVLDINDYHSTKKIVLLK